MRHLVWIAAVLVGCSGSNNNPGGLTGDGGVDGGVDAGFDGGGGDGGGPDGGPDGGPGGCVNTIEAVPMQPRSHSWDAPGCSPSPCNCDTLTQAQCATLPQPIYDTNPPVSGPHYGIWWACWRVHDRVVPRGYWVHNVEHGGVVFLYRPDAPPEIVAALRRVYDSISADPWCGVEEPEPLLRGRKRVILAQDPLLDTAWAVVASGNDSGVHAPFDPIGHRIKANCIASEAALKDFAERYRHHADEITCYQSGTPYPEGESCPTP